MKYIKRQEKTNRERLEEELSDLLSIIKVIEKYEGILVVNTSLKKSTENFKKIYKYLDYSKKLGIVEE